MTGEGTINKNHSEFFNVFLFCSFLFVLITFLKSVLLFINPQVSSKTLSGIKSQKITSLWLIAIVDMLLC